MLVVNTPLLCVTTQQLCGVGVVLAWNAKWVLQSFATNVLRCLNFYEIFLNFRNFWSAFSGLSREETVLLHLFIRGCKLQATPPSALSIALKVQRACSGCYNNNKTVWFKSPTQSLTSTNRRFPNPRCARLTQQHQRSAGQAGVLQVEDGQAAADPECSGHKGGRVVQEGGVPSVQVLQRTGLWRTEADVEEKSEYRIVGGNWRF